MYNTNPKSATVIKFDDKMNYALVILSILCHESQCEVIDPHPRYGEGHFSVLGAWIFPPKNTVFIPGVIFRNFYYGNNIGRPYLCFAEILGKIGIQSFSLIFWCFFNQK